ncbi:MAG: lycopene cyclase domain-containing protein [Candidatus Microsaccharimonas sp.]
MMTYLVLNIIFILAVCIAFRIKVHRPTRRTLVVFFILFSLTVVFDSMLVYFHIVEYAQNNILGLYIGFAPFEDYFYPLLAVILIPALWQSLGRRHD